MFKTIDTVRHTLSGNGGVALSQTRPDDWPHDQSNEGKEVILRQMKSRNAWPA